MSDATDAARFRALAACTHWTVENVNGTRRYETGNGRAGSLADIADDLPDPRDGATCTNSPIEDEDGGRTLRRGTPVGDWVLAVAACEKCTRNRRGGWCAQHKKQRKALPEREA